MINEQRNFIVKYLIKNQIDRSNKRPYLEAAKRFNVAEEKIRRIWRTLRTNGTVEQNERPARKFSSSAKLKVVGDTAEVTKTTYKRVRTLEDLVEVCEIDTQEWDIKSWECNKWEVGAAGDDGKIT